MNRDEAVIKERRESERNICDFSTRIHNKTWQSEQGCLTSFLGENDILLGNFPRREMKQFVCSNQTKKKIKSNNTGKSKLTNYQKANFQKILSDKTNQQSKIENSEGTS